MLNWILCLDNTDDFRLILKTILIMKTILKITAFRGFSLNILKVIFKSNSLSINEKIIFLINFHNKKTNIASCKDRNILHKTVKKLADYIQWL